MSEFFSPEILIRAYQEGFFPMAESRMGEIYWHSPDPRAIIPLDKVKTPRSLKQSIKKHGFRFTVNNDFEKVISACADRDETWISDDIIENYLKLHRMGHAHSVETFVGDELVGGLYGVSLGGAFFGESMFNNISDASKAAFYHLVKRLKEKGFILLDSQYINEHTKMLGAIEVPREFYLKLLSKALILPVSFD